MNEQDAPGLYTGAAVVARVTRRSLPLFAAGAAVSLALHLTALPSPPWWSLPAGVLFGGVLGLANFRWLAAAVERIYLRKGATVSGSKAAGAFISVLKLSAIFVILFLVIRLQIFNIFAVLAGLSLCFLAIIWEGITLMQNLAGHGNRSGT